MVRVVIKGINGMNIVTTSPDWINETDKAAFINCVETYNIEDTIYQKIVNEIDSGLTDRKEERPRSDVYHGNLIWICHFLQRLSNHEELSGTTIQKHVNGLGLTDEEYINTSIYKFIDQLKIESHVNEMYGMTNRIQNPPDLSNMTVIKPKETVYDEFHVEQMKRDSRVFELRKDTNKDPHSHIE